MDIGISFAADQLYTEFAENRRQNSISRQYIESEYSIGYRIPGLSGYRYLYNKSIYGYPDTGSRYRSSIAESTAGFRFQDLPDQ